MASKIDSKNQNSEHRLSKNKDSLMPATSSIHADNRFGRKSRSMFFIRHTAHPKNLRFITGVGGIQVCAMKEDSYNLPDNVLEQIKSSTIAAATMNPSILSTQKSIENYISDPRYALRFDSSGYNQELLKKYEKKIVSKNRKERILPPIKHWTSTYTLADDTRRWKLELNNLAKKVGILTNEEVETEPAVITKNDQIKIESLEIRNVQSLEFQRSATQVTSNFSNNHNKTQTAGIHRKKINQDENVSKEERVKTGRFNESRGSALGTRKLASSRLRTSLNFNANKNGKVILCIEEAEREMWLLQILCQILNTESMQDIQSWLVSSGFQEKEAMKELIQKALDGLNQSGRIDIDKINFNPNDKTTQVDFELIRNSITSMIENSKNVLFANNNNLNNNQNNNLNIQLNENKNEEMDSNNNNINNQNNNNGIVNADNIVIRIKLHDSTPKAEEASAVIQSAPKPKDEENPFTSGSDFKSVSLINMDPYKLERTRTMSTFENYLSKSTYFQSKSKTNNFSIPKKHQPSVHRPFTCKETKNDPFQNASQSLEILNQPLSKKIMNKFSRVELVDVKNLCSKEDSVLEEPELLANNDKVQTKKSVVINDHTTNPSNVKLKLETNKDSQVLTIEDN